MKSIKNTTKFLLRYVETDRQIYNSLNKVEIYCLINKRKNPPISLTFYKHSLISKQITSTHCPILFTAYSAEAISHLCELHKKVYKHLSASHGLYLGRELTKLELAYLMNQEYIQN